MGNGSNPAIKPDLFSAQQLPDTLAASEPKSKNEPAVAKSPSYALPTNLPSALRHLDNDQLDRLLSAVLAERQARGGKRLTADEPSRKTSIKEVAPPLAQGKLNAVRAAFWNPQHINGLPAEVRNVLARMCGGSRAQHQFAGYFQNSRILVLHFEHFRCGDRGALCTQAGCLHQVYVSTGGRYRLLRSYYAPEGN